jgi:uncharacterized protein YndB with AHSA1/START domain
MSGPPDHPAIDWSEREVGTSRRFGTSRERVFEAWSDSAQLQRWWGPAGFTNTFELFDFRPGGAWRILMRGPDGATYLMDKLFSEIVYPERITIQHLDPAHRHQLLIRLDEDAGATLLTWRMQFESAAEYARVREVLLAANEQNLDRLALHLGALG